MRRSAASSSRIVLRFLLPGFQLVAGLLARRAAIGRGDSVKRRFQATRSWARLLQPLRERIDFVGQFFACPAGGFELLGDDRAIAGFGVVLLLNLLQLRRSTFCRLGLGACSDLLAESSFFLMTAICSS